MFSAASRASRCRIAAGSCRGQHLAEEGRVGPGRSNASLNFRLLTVSVNASTNPGGMATLSRRSSDSMTIKARARSTGIARAAEDRPSRLDDVPEQPFVRPGRRCRFGRGCLRRSGGRLLILGPGRLPMRVSQPAAAIVRKLAIRTPKIGGGKHCAAAWVILTGNDFAQ